MVLAKEPDDGLFPWAFFPADVADAFHGVMIGDEFEGDGVVGVDEVSELLIFFPAFEGGLRHGGEGIDVGIQWRGIFFEVGVVHLFVLHVLGENIREGGMGVVKGRFALAKQTTAEEWQECECQ